MKKPFLLLLLAVAALAMAQDVRKDIGDRVQVKTENVEVKHSSRIWRIQADANGTVTVFFEIVAVFPDGTETKISSTSTSRPIESASAPLGALEKLARSWLAEDETAAASASPVPVGAVD
jgi:predicted membrane-bound mannosyltransferase